MIRLSQARPWGALSAVAALLSAVLGLVFPEAYRGLFPPDFLPGAGAQDVLTVGVSLVLLGLIATVKPHQIKTQVVILGLLGSVFYLYGIFVIERVYNAFYLIYLVAFAAGFWSLVASVAGPLPRVSLDPVWRWVSGLTSLVIATLFTVLWVSALIPLMVHHDRIEFLYSIYILDLCFVMPAFFALGISTLRGRSLGLLFTPGLLILGFFVIFPLGLNEVAKPSAGLSLAMGPLVVSFGFSAFMVGLAAVLLARLRIDPVLESESPESAP